MRVIELSLSDKVFENINKYELIQEGEKVLVGVSGGPDSLCLLHVLLSLKNKLNINLAVIHINHMLRGKEAYADETYVKSQCEKFGIENCSVILDVKNIAKKDKISNEEAGRKVRYEEFETYAKKINASKIAVAHNLNDQTETIILNIIRGTGLDGLKGMDFKRDNIIRPLLNIERKDIEDYCTKNSLMPRTDATNFEDTCTRNKVRLKLIPFISEYFETDINLSINKMKNLIKEDADFLEIITEEYFNKSLLSKTNSEICLDISKLDKLHNAIQKRVIRYALNELKGNLTNVSAVHIDSILDLVKNGKSGSKLKLVGTIEVLKDYGTLKIFSKNKIEEILDYEKKIIIPGETKVVQTNSTIKASIIKKEYDFDFYDKINYKDNVQYFDFEIFTKDIVIRNRKNGDVFKPLKSNGTKKLKEYFIDKKISRDMRDKISLVAEDNKIVWIIGHKISDTYKVSNKTKITLKLEYFKKSTK